MFAKGGGAGINNGRDSDGSDGRKLMRGAAPGGMLRVARHVSSYLTWCDALLLQLAGSGPRREGKQAELAVAGPGRFFGCKPEIAQERSQVR